MNAQRIIQSSLTALVLGLTAGCFGSAPTVADSLNGQPGTSARCTTPEEAERIADQVLQLVNLERAEVGLSPLVSNPSLEKLAGDYACRMIEGGFFGHNDPDTGHGVGERAFAAKYAFYAVGENLAAGQQTPAEAVRLWMESPSHRANILDARWRDIGIAVRYGGEYAVYWVQEFGDPANFQLP